MARGIARAYGRVVDRLGGKAYARLILVLALVLGLDGADKGAIGAMAPYLQSAFGIDKTELGLLLTVTAAASAIATLPFGWAADWTRRTRLLSIAVVLWALAMGLSAASSSYLFLLATRAFLGMAIAAAVPIVASLVGDFFAPAERGHVYGSILAGELVGTGIGLIVVGEAAIFSWRVGLLVLVFPALVAAWLLYRLPEPARGGADRVERGQQNVESGAKPKHDRSQDGSSQRSQLVRRKTQEAGVPPREELLPERAPAEQSVMWALKYVLRIPTNVVLIAASALAYYLFAGIRTFGVEYAESRFHLHHAAAVGVLIGIGAGMLIGVNAGGRIADRLLKRGVINARPIVAIVPFFLAGFLFIPGLIFAELYIALPLFFLAALALGAVSPPLDAARLDIMHFQLWGRAESARMILRRLGEAAAPPLFGYVAGHFFAGGAHSLEWTFLIMLGPYFAGGLIGLISMRTYARDVATAAAYTERTLIKRKNDDTRSQR